MDYSNAINNIYWLVTGNSKTVDKHNHLRNN